MGNLRGIFLDGDFYIFDNPTGSSYYSDLHNLLHRVFVVRAGIHYLDFIRLQNLRKVKVMDYNSSKGAELFCSEEDGLDTLLITSEIGRYGNISQIFSP